MDFHSWDRELRKMSKKHIDKNFNIEVAHWQETFAKAKHNMQVESYADLQCDFERAELEDLKYIERIYGRTD